MMCNLIYARHIICIHDLNTFNSGVRFRIPDEVNVYSIPGVSGQGQRELLTNFSSYKSWTYNYDASALITIVVNELHGDFEAYMHWLLNSTEHSAVVQQRLGSSYKLDLREPSVLRKESQNRGLQSSSPFAIEASMLPKDRSTEGNRAAYGKWS